MTHNPLPPEYSHLQPEWLPEILRELEAFHQSKAYKLLWEHQYKEGLDAAKYIARSCPTNLAEFFAREQALGQLEQIEILLEWLPAKIQEFKKLTEPIVKHEETE